MIFISSPLSPLPSSSPLSLLFSPSPSFVSSSLLSLRFLLWSFLSLICVVAASAAALPPLVAAAVAALLLLVLVVVVVVVCVVLRFGTVFRYFRLCSLSLRPLLSSCHACM